LENWKSRIYWIGCYFYFFSIGELPVQTVAICGYVELLSALLGETLSLLQIVGAVLILGGAAFRELFREKTIMERIGSYMTLLVKLSLLYGFIAS
jgi:drug/metabolite transporter (DMT)-like permease